ncbi:MAG: O-antigen ligase family protein, partial [Lachnospiraceae bacterium]|nr:O-antigen ligase family protein [Lachnospiraceae bacterium]
LTSIYIYLLKKSLKIKINIEIIGFALMLLFGSIASCINAVDKSSAIQYIIIYTLLFIFLWENEILNDIIIIDENTAVSFFAMISLILGIGFFITHRMTAVWSLSRMAIFYNLKNGIASNTLAGVMAPFVCGCVLILIESKDIKSKMLSFLAVMMMLPVLLAIQSRGAYLGMSIAVLWILFRGRSTRIICAFICLFFVVLLIFINRPELYIRFFGRFSSVVYRTGSSLNGREKLYKIAWEMFQEHPFIGNGFWQFYAKGIAEKDPHNFLLAYLASTGIVGCTGFLLYLVVTYKRWINSLKMKMDNSKLLCEIGITASIIFIVHGFVEPSLSTQAPLSIFILLALLPVKIKKEKCYD